MKLPEYIQKLFQSSVEEDIIIGVHLLDKLDNPSQYFTEHFLTKKDGIKIGPVKGDVLILEGNETYAIAMWQLVLWKENGKCTWRPDIKRIPL